MDFLNSIMSATSSPWFGPALGLAGMYLEYRYPGATGKAVSILEYVLSMLKRPAPEKQPQS